MPPIRTALDHLTELGVTHVELLPVQDFDNDETRSQYNWGYIPTAYFSPEGMYATNANDDSRVRELQALVDALHARGIGVIMDVVYNHTATNAPFDAVVPGYYYRHLPDGSLADGSGCGNEFRTEAPMARKLMLDSLKYWTRDYGIDGYRFDLMALLDQETMRQAERELRAVNPSIVLYGEPWTGGSSPLREKCDKPAICQLPEGAFNDDFRNALKGSPDGRDAGFIQNGANREALKSAMLVSHWFASPGQSINYMTCHDNLVLWDKLKISMPGAADDTLVETMQARLSRALHLAGRAVSPRRRGVRAHERRQQQLVRFAGCGQPGGLVAQAQAPGPVHVHPRRHRAAQGAPGFPAAHARGGRSATEVRGHAGRQDAGVHVRRCRAAGRNLATRLRGAEQ